MRHDRRTYPTREEILANYSYYSETGWFEKLHKRGRPNGKVAGCIGPSGYLRIGINGKIWLAHRLAWIVVHGRDTELTIDHINGVRSDNRIANLREATQVTQGRNKQLLCNNESGVMGVYRHPKNNVWVAQVGINGKRFYLGSFATIEEARAARFAADRVIGFHVNHGREPAH